MVRKEKGKHQECPKVFGVIGSESLVTDYKDVSLEHSSLQQMLANHWDQSSPGDYTYLLKVETFAGKLDSFMAKHRVQESELLDTVRANVKKDLKADKVLHSASDYHKDLDEVMKGVRDYLKGPLADWK